MDKFERFFKENRLRLDIEDLDNSLKESIVHRFRIHDKKRSFIRMYAAVSTMAIIVLGYLYFNQTRQHSGIFNEIATDLVKEETVYIESINNSVNAIKKQKIPVEYESMFEDFIQQLQLIDRQYVVYKAQVEQHGYSEEIIQQIIYNYQLKLNVLQMLQTEINKINNLSKKEKHEYKKIQLDI